MRSWLVKHWLEFGIVALTLFVLWQLAGVPGPQPAQPPAPPSAQQSTQNPNLQFAAALPGNTAHSVDSLVVGGTTIPYSSLGHPVSVKAGDPFLINGWATVGSGPAGAVIAVVDSSTVASAPVNGDSAAIAAALKNAAFAKSGFTLSLPTANLLPGRHSIAFRIVTPDGSAYYDSPVHLAVYATSPQGPAAAISGAIDPLNRAPVKGSTLEVSGWAIDPVHRTLLKAVAIVVDKKTVTAARYGEARPQVASSLHDAAYRDSGFSAAIPLAALRPGIHALSIRGTDIFGATSELVTSVTFSK